MVAEEAADLLRRFNDAVSEPGGNVERLATPSESACRGCSFRGVCLPFLTRESVVETGWRRTFAGTVLAIERRDERVALMVALEAGALVASFTDTPGQTWSCSIDWNDGSAPDPGAVVEPTALDAGTCTGSHLFTAVGVYTVTMSVTDACGQASAAVYRYAVVYDASMGFVTGGGWITSPPGAYTPTRR